MKKILLKTLITLLAFGGTVALAETNVEVNARANATVEARPAAKSLLQRVKALVPIRAEIKENIMERREEKASSTKERVVRKISHRFDKMTERFEATIVREESIMARVVSRIEKIKTAGGKTETSEKLVAEAKIHLSEARVAYENLKIVVNTAIEAEATASTTVKVNLDAVRKAAMEVEKHLREAHNSLVRAVVNLRGVSSTVKLQTTTTAEVNTQN